MLHTLPEVSFPIEACQGSAILSQFFTQNLERHSTVLWVLGAINDRRAAFSHECAELVASNRSSY
jgi:hypothetical protein